MAVGEGDAEGDAVVPIQCWERSTTNASESACADIVVALMDGWQHDAVDGVSELVLLVRITPVGLAHRGNTPVWTAFSGPPSLRSVGRRATEARWLGAGHTPEWRGWVRATGGVGRGSEQAVRGKARRNRAQTELWR